MRRTQLRGRGARGDDDEPIAGVERRRPRIASAASAARNAWRSGTRTRRVVRGVITAAGAAPAGRGCCSARATASSARRPPPTTPPTRGRRCRRTRRRTLAVAAVSANRQAPTSRSCVARRSSGTVQPLQPLGAAAQARTAASAACSSGGPSRRRMASSCGCAFTSCSSCAADEALVVAVERLAQQPLIAQQPQPARVAQAGLERRRAATRPARGGWRPSLASSRVEPVQHLLDAGDARAAPPRCAARCVSCCDSFA